MGCIADEVGSGPGISSILFIEYRRVFPSLGGSQPSGLPVPLIVGSSAGKVLQQLQIQAKKAPIPEKLFRVFCLLANDLIEQAASGKPLGVGAGFGEKGALGV